MTWLREFNSSPSGSKADLQQRSGSQDSSSLRPSSRDVFRTMPVSTRSLSISSVTTLRSVMMLRHPPSPSLLRTVASSMECTWKVLDGTVRLTSWTILTPSSSTQNSLCSGCCPRRIARSQRLASTIAPFTRYCHVQEPCQQLVTRPISAYSWSLAVVKKRQSGLEPASLSSLHSDIED